MTALLIFLALAGLFMAFVAVSACIVSGNISDHERRIEALKALGWAEWTTDCPASDEGDN